jgi:aspartate ammonia-lyase
VDSSIGIVTALNPFLGYARASEIAREALASGRRVYDLVLERGWMTREQLDQILLPEVLTRPHYSTVHRPKAEA